MTVENPFAGLECNCMLCREPDPDDHRTGSPKYQGIAQHVRDHGWSVMGISDGDGLPEWAFSVGLWHSHRSPEVAIFGLNLPDMQQWVNKIGNQIRDGRHLQPDERRMDVLPGGFPVVIRPVHESWYEDLFGSALGFYGLPPLPIVQAIWPDRNGILPWEDGCGEGCRTNQPWLWIAKEEHPAGLWTNLDAINAWTTHGVRANVQVFVTKRIVDGEEPVRGVVHDHDGSWQFLDGGPVESPDQIAAAHLRHILLDHPYVAEFAHLPVGTQAWQQEDGSWGRFYVEPESDEE